MSTVRLERIPDIQAWKTWMTPRRFFYICMIVILAISVILFVVAVICTSSPQNGVLPADPPFTKLSPWIVAPSQVGAGSMLLSSDYQYAMVFSDNLYLVNVISKRILWAAQIFNVSSPAANLELRANGWLTIVNGQGATMWSNYTEGTPPSADNSWVLVVTPTGSLQIQTQSNVAASIYTNPLWSVDETVVPTIPILSSLTNPFRLLPQTFILQSNDKQFYCEFRPTGQLAILRYDSGGTPLWMSTFNEAIDVPSLPYTLKMGATSVLSIEDNSLSTVWSSQSVWIPGTYNLSLSDNGILQVIMVDGDPTVPVWTSDTTFSFNNPPLSWGSPIANLPQWSVQADDRIVQARFQAFGFGPVSEGSGSLELINTSVGTIDISNSAPYGQTFGVTREGTVTIQDGKGQTLYQIEIPSTTSLPITLVVQNQQLQAWSASYDLVWTRPLTIPVEVPSRILGSDSFLVSYTHPLLPNLVFLLQNPSFTLVLDTYQSLLEVLNRNTGETVKNQVFSFVPETKGYRVQLSRFGLFSLRSEQTQSSLWNSGTAQLDFSEIPYSEINTEGVWQIIRDTVVLWPRTKLFSVSSMLTVNPNLTNPSPTQSLQTLLLESPNGEYQVSFDQSGVVRFQEVSSGTTLWETPTQPPSIFSLVQNGDFVVSDAKTQLPQYTLPANITRSAALPVTMWVSNTGSLFLTNFENETVWQVSKQSPDTPHSIQSPFSMGTSASFRLLSNPPTVGLLFTNGILQVVDAKTLTVIWQQPTIPTSSNVGPYFAEFQNSGNWLVRDSSVPARTIWASNTGNFYDPEPPYTLSLQPSGQLSILVSRLYNTPSPLIWSSDWSKNPLSTSSDAILLPSQWVIETPSRLVQVQVQQTPDCASPSNTFQYTTAW